MTCCFQTSCKAWIYTVYQVWLECRADSKIEFLPGLYSGALFLSISSPGAYGVRLFGIPHQNATYLEWQQYAPSNTLYGYICGCYIAYTHKRVLRARCRRFLWSGSSGTTCERLRSYSVHLTLDEGVDGLITRLILSHQVKRIPVYLQSADRTHAILTNGEEPVEEGVEHIDRNPLEGDERILFSELAISGDVNQSPVSPLIEDRKVALLIP